MHLERDLYPDLEHLQNIVDSDEFPNITLNYLVYGDETPAKIVNKVDFDLSHWTHADFCELIGRLKIKYPQNINIENIIESAADGISYEEWDYAPKGDIPQKRSVVITIEEMSEMDGPKIREFSLGQALALFHHDIKESENNRDEEIRQLSLTKAVNRMRDENKFENAFLHCLQPHLQLADLIWVPTSCPLGTKLNRHVYLAF